MSKRTVWTVAFLAVTGTAVGMELWAALDHDPSTVPWTNLAAEYVPQPVTFAVIALLCAWIPGHLTFAYRHNPPSEGGTMRYAKAWAAVVAAALQAAQAAIPMSDAAHGYVAIALALAGAVAVYAIPNQPKAPEGVQGVYQGKF